MRIQAFSAIFGLFILLSPQLSMAEDKDACRKFPALCQYVDSKVGSYYRTANRFANTRHGRAHGVDVVYTIGFRRETSAVSAGLFNIAERKKLLPKQEELVGQAIRAGGNWVLSRNRHCLLDGKYKVRSTGEVLTRITLLTGKPLNGAPVEQDPRCEIYNSENPQRLNQYAMRSDQVMFDFFENLVLDRLKVAIQARNGNGSAMDVGSEIQNTQK